MVICAVFNCNSNSDKKLKRNMNDSSFKQTKFFRFPKNKEIAKIWIQKCGRKDKFNIQSSYICSKHFVQEHYRRNLQHELLNYSPKNSKKLKDDAVPQKICALQFKYRLKNYLLGRNESIISQSANVEEDREAAFKMNVDEGYSIPNSNNEEIEIDDCENLLANRMLSDLTD
ncbi:uncharacterized protein LOC129606452 [Condylostylus longicornis]|uniref:uncharacterized protein LOC129606452 n=1 Tax=Condylostylus longicornis TaxID=2530218 RepID=UPI00244E0565|nr:uncharacterized protein LOC129606452 [Condylostylus longicornis]